MSNHSDEVSSGPPSPPAIPSQKPLFPYHVGSRFTLYRHQPPAPYGKIYSDDPAPCFDPPPDYNQLEWVLSHPPAQGLTTTEDAQSITITGVIRSGEDCGAQVLITDKGCVAKIYDPLYYNPDPDDFGRKIDDVSFKAGSDYSIEAAAYSETVGSKVQGTIMPIYYGSWTMDIPYHLDNMTSTREVRLILLERVSGTQMSSIVPRHLAQEERENIMRKLIEAEYDLRLAGVGHEDLHPRNVIISASSAFADPNIRITLVDFGCSMVYRIYCGCPAPWRVHNPCFEWANASMWSMMGWLPYCDDERINWVWKCWGDGCEGRYVKVERNPDDPSGGPKKPWRRNKRK